MAHLTAKARTGRLNSATHDSHDSARLLGELRALWDATAKAEPARRSKLRAKIVQAIETLATQVGDELTTERPGRTAYPRFGRRVPGEPWVASDPSPASYGPRFPAEPVLCLYDKDLTDQALTALTQASQFSNIGDFREHLSRTLAFNTESTRRRAANYLTARYFPFGIIHDDLSRFAAAAKDKPWLGDVLFYLTCRVEKVVAMVADEVVWPALADGGVSGAGSRISYRAGSRPGARTRSGTSGPPSCGPMSGSASAARIGPA